MRVLVTGGCGLVGRHMVRALLERGDEVVVVDSMLPGSGARTPDMWSEWWGDRPMGQISFVTRDIRTCVHETPVGVGAGHFDLVLHLAAVVGGRRTIDGSPLDVAEDLGIDAAVIRWAERVRPGRLVYFSSSAAYPVHLQDRLSGSVDLRLSESCIEHTDTHIGVPDQTYGWAKLTGERLALIAAERGLPVTVYRPFSGYAEDQGDEYPMSAICRRALGVPEDKQDIDVWGDGTQVRDWIHMDDVVRIVLGTCDRVPSGSIMNLCTGVGTSMREIASLALCKARDWSIGLNDVKVCGIGGPSGVQHRVGDPTAMRATLVTYELSTDLIPVARGVQRMIDHLRSSK